MNRREFWRRTGLAGLAMAATSPEAHAQLVSRFDLLIRGATIVDGTGGAVWQGDIGVKRDRIAAVGKISRETADEVIDAAGLHVSPGFIDIHAHSDDSIFQFPLSESRVFQGITTEVTGNCGGSEAPEMPVESSPLGAGPLPPEWRGIQRYRRELESAGLSVNHAPLVGQGTLRENRIGLENRALSPEELQAVIRDLEEALEEGAFGLSSGLEYIPGRFTPPEELRALCSVVSRYGGLYASHIRNEESELLEAVDEALEVGRRTGVRVEISHLKAAGRANWPKQEAAIDLLESARRAGVSVLADAYPYEAYFTGLTIFVSTWAMEGGWKSLRGRLEDSNLRQRIRSEVDLRVRQDPGDYELIQISRVRSSGSRGLVGRRLSEIAEALEKEPADALLDLLLGEEGSVSFVGFGMSQENVTRVIAHPLVMLGSDGSSLAPDPSGGGGAPHPRSYGAFARALAYFVREKGILTLPAAIRKITSLPADQVGLRDRGRIAVGMKADLALFDMEKVQDRATYERPEQTAVGFPHVLVNGQFVVRDGRHTGRRPGRVLERGS